MGNQLAGIAPSQIYPVEHYLTELPDFTFEKNLGSTRFFKVARVKSKEGLAIVKVFAIHDPSLPLAPHKETLERIRRVLSAVPNALPFQKVVENDKAGLLVRQFIKDNLYDRISTRPFLNSIEKRWIAFQLLHALAEAHKLGICHGDIKLENIMVTGWYWVLLTDFASFKPTYLPEDNPADFSYFFDTSRRRTCNIAPERFVKTLNPDSSHYLPEEGIGTGELTPAMDIFSLGCVLTELFTEGHPPFYFSQLLSYRSGEYSPDKILEKIEDDMIQHMLQKDPSQRLSAEQYLDQQRDRVFPQYFYTFLGDYIKEFATLALSPDEKVARLRQDIHAILYSLVLPKGAQAGEASVGCEGDHVPPSTLSPSPAGSDGLCIVVAVLTSCLRSLKHCSAKLQALELIRELCPRLSSDIILDRLLPYMLYLINDKYPRVRAAAVETLTTCLTPIDTLPRRYMSPWTVLCIVRMALAENIALLAETALRFLDLSTQHEVSSPDGTNVEPPVQAQHHHQGSYDTELQALQHMVQQMVSTLLTDSNNIVKQMLLEKGITRLCLFFGRQKANDVLLSHMITFLNDKEDRHLRASFFDSIVGVAAYVGWQCSPILKPLLQQVSGSNYVFLASPALLKAVQTIQTAFFFPICFGRLSACSNKNLWIRQNTVGFVCAVTKTLSLADTQCKLRPMLQPYLKRSVVEMDKEVAMLNALEDPLPRSLYDYVVKLDALPSLLEDLRNRQVMRSIVRGKHQPPLPNVDHQLKSAMKEHLAKIHKYKRSASESENVDAKLRGGEIDLEKLYMSNRCHSTDLLTLKIGDEPSQALLHSRSYRKKGPPIESPQVTMTQPLPQQHSPAGDGDPNMELHVSGAESAESAAPSENTSPKQPQKIFTGITIDTATVHCLSCQAELQLLLNKKRTEFAREQTVREAIDDPAREDRPLPPKWRPRGTLVAHMHEHKGAIHRVEVNSNKTSPLKTRSLDPHEDGCVVDLQHFDTGLQSVLVYATVYGSIIGWDLRSPSTAWCFENNPRHGVITSFCIDPQHNWLVCGTSEGKLICWDMRFQLPSTTVSHPAGKFELCARVRRVSIDPLYQSCVWAAVEGNNEVSLWDLETQARLRTLWASMSPPLSEKQASSSAPVHSVYSMYISPLECGPFMLTAGSDMRIRLWDINNPLASHVVAGSATDTLTPSFSYKSNLIDGTKVIQEVYSSRPRKDQPSSEQPKRYPEQPPTGHNDCISDIGIVQTSQTFIVSASKNGVVKVWK
ncbi:hypothetical protein HPB52_010151 [Rhipicephalus sanguineus]|uniref:non-specific serine/threonine protein kinase n=1 Tax=Rhipicephalus sanguineus TaxID=34632 RepID=A0A9D4SY47_RHISA|nr:hypothetical protein HPB52_010151 [Rhipicephalus sanguineus]